MFIKMPNASNLLYTMLVAVFFVGCENAGTTRQQLSGNESELPEELKGIKIYRVATGNGGSVKVAILNGNINSTTYKQGKTKQSTIIVNKQNRKLIEVKEVLIENDSVLVCRK